ncbi:mechanosensitive ion channel domain-containing protein [Shewanella spartinae]|uniref:mechanosensitive ion channel domain-containing protein n=1 Tax=Shewanella spartinae TaxID=2864205 RepID=UPI001C65E945|nr:mechanosensitive ion channel domain-containing protein [Shewanella spartinae]QYJ94344.1 mechanosensitive ion channel [Shewanella spartinae]
MSRILLIILCLISFSGAANSPLNLNKRLGLGQEPQVASKSTAEQLSLLEEQLTEQQALQSSFDAIIHQYQSQKQALTQQLKEAATPLEYNPKQDLSQQASLSYLRLSELKETEANLATQVNELIKRQQQLPSLISQANLTLAKHKQATSDDNQPLSEMQRRVYVQSLSTLESELASSQKQIALTQQQLALVRSQLVQQEALIERLNGAIAEQRHKATAATIAASQIETSITDDAIAIKLNAQNQAYGEQLKQLTHEVTNVMTLQEQAETQYQFQAKQITNIQQQIALVKLNSAFGERFLRILYSLPKPPSQDKISNEIANARLARYQIEQDQTLHPLLGDTEQLTPLQSKLVGAQKELQRQLLENYDLYLGELAELRVLYEQLSQQYQTLKTTLNEHLFWVANANSIDGYWLGDLYQSTQWLLTQAPWHQVQDSLSEQSTLWSWWVILMVLCLVMQDLVTPKFTQLMAKNVTYVGNVTQDKFIYSFNTLIGSLLYSCIKPLPLISGGLIFYFSNHNLVSSVGMGILAIGMLYQLYRLTYLLALDKGLLIGHFKGDKTIIRAGQQRLRALTVLAMPIVGVIGFTEVLETSLVRNSLGRGAFILLALMLFWFYRDMLSLSKQEHHYHQDDKNKRLLQKLLWSILILLPPACAVLAFRGYYFTAYQMLLQLQLSLILSLSFMLLYQLIKRWMLIERRRIAFNRAKAKRAEILAQREKEDDPNSNEPPDTYEEPVVDLETISSQSLGLVRSLLTLAFLISLIGLWTQTHSAIFSFLDGITLWTSSSTVDGIAQQIPITLKSLLLGLIIVGFSLMIATNLPGLLELMILQRLDLTQGTGFAITTVSRYLVVFFGMLSGFSTLGMEWSKLQWLVAALSVGLGFGLQEIFANFISGLIILFEKPVRIGDTVTIRELTGTVSKIQIRATTIVDWDRKEIIVPNKAFITEQLINWSLSDPITRVIVYVSVARDSDPARVEAALYQAVKECDDALTTPEPEVWFAGFGQHTQDYEIRAYAKDMNTRWPLRHKLHKQVSKKLRENHLELAYPQLEVHISGQSKETQGIIRS